VWGSITRESMDNIVWGSDNKMVSGRCADASDDNIVWGSDNIVWGSDDNIVWGSCGHDIVWDNDDDNIVWGSSVLTGGRR